MISSIKIRGAEKEYSVRLKNNVELHQVTLKEGKLSKLSDYVPEGPIAACLSCIIHRVIEILVGEVSHSLETLKDNRENSEVGSGGGLEPFNLKVLIHTLHFLIRESPSLAPWMAKFKCRRIVLGAVREQQSEMREKLSNYLGGLLSNKTTTLSNIPELGFLQLLIRLSSPFLLNCISPLLF